MTHASQPPHRCATCQPGYNEEETASAAVASTSNIPTTLMASNSHRTSSLAIYLDALEDFVDIDENEIGEGIAETVITFGKR